MSGVQLLGTMVVRRRLLAARGSSPNISASKASPLSSLMHVGKLPPNAYEAELLKEIRSFDRNNPGKRRLLLEAIRAADKLSFSA